MVKTPQTVVTETHSARMAGDSATGLKLNARRDGSGEWAERKEKARQAMRALSKFLLIHSISNAFTPFASPAPISSGRQWDVRAIKILHNFEVGLRIVFFDRPEHRS